MVILFFTIMLSFNLKSIKPSPHIKKLLRCSTLFLVEKYNLLAIPKKRITNIQCLDKLLIKTPFRSQSSFVFSNKKAKKTLIQTISPEQNGGANISRPELFLFQKNLFLHAILVRINNCM